MKTKVPNTTILGFLFVFNGVFGVFRTLGVSFGLGLISIDIDTMIAIGGLEGILCSCIAAKKDRNTNTGFWAGFFFGPLAIIYYLVCKRGLSKKEKELHEWELEKKYKEMIEEKAVRSG